MKRTPVLFFTLLVFASLAVSAEIELDVQEHVLYNGLKILPSGPLWYRDLASLPEEEFSEDVGRILENLGARSMVIGHTITQGRIQRRFEGRTWLIDTGISKYVEDGGCLSALVIENGEFKPVLFQ